MGGGDCREDLFGAAAIAEDWADSAAAMSKLDDYLEIFLEIFLEVRGDSTVQPVQESCQRWWRKKRGRRGVKGLNS